MAAVDLTRTMQAAIASAVGAGYFLATDKMYLTDSAFTPSRTSTTADFIAAQQPTTNVVPFVLATGYATGVDAQGNGLLISQDLALFLPEVSAVLPFSVGGFVIMDTANTVAKAFGTFDNPFTFDTGTDALLVKANLTQTNVENEDAEFVAGP